MFDLPVTASSVSRGMAFKSLLVPFADIALRDRRLLVGRGRFLVRFAVIGVSKTISGNAVGDFGVDVVRK